MLTAAALHKVRACQIHIAPTPGEPRASGPHRVGVARAVRVGLAGQAEKHERRNGEHEQEMLKHVRAEEVAAREHPDGRHERHEEEHDGEREERRARVRRAR